MHRPFTPAGGRAALRSDKRGWRRLLVLALAIPALTRAETPALPKGVKVVPGFQVTLYAAPPNVGYPTCLAAAPSGELFVGIDENGSIDAKPGRGRVVRCIDRDGDGVADEFKTFAEMDSPRGIWFDNNVLYVQHPPLIEAFHDDNGDGIADRHEVLVRGLGFDLKFRGADHTINGMQMGIDGFLYIACGDYGGTNAVGRDGTRIQMHGGGVVRVRPDGSGLEIVSRGQRNIYDVAISPEMDLFTRDNTNDGGGWDVRLSHVVMFGQYGYPTLFKNSPSEIIQPLADYGGGSPCGSLFMDEPGFPKNYGTALYTCEWGRSKIYRHPLERSGATYKNNLPQIEFMDVPRATDMVVDGLGHIYVSSWANGGFTYSGPNVGYVLRVVAGEAPAVAGAGQGKPQSTAAALEKSKAPRTFPDLRKASDSDLVDLMAGETRGAPGEGSGAVCRLHTQREILRRGANPATVKKLERLAASAAPLSARIAAVFTLEQLAGANAFGSLAVLAKQDDLREAVLRALGDNKAHAAAAPLELLVSGLADPNPRVRLQAVTALGRLQKTESAAAILPLVSDADPIVSHVSINVLAALHAGDACLKALDSPGTANLVPGAVRVLAQLHENNVVDGLLARLPAAGDPAVRKSILHALARLYKREADWDGRWWGTQPDTTGPYFRPVTWEGSDKIAEALRKELANTSLQTATSLQTTKEGSRVTEGYSRETNGVSLRRLPQATGGEGQRWLLIELQKNRVDLPEVTSTVLKLAENDPSFNLVAVELFSGRGTLPEQAIPLFAAVAKSADTDGATRLKAMRTLIRASASPTAFEAALGCVVAMTQRDASAPGQAWEEFARDNRHSQRVAVFEKLAASGTPAERTVAFGVLTTLATQRFSSRAVKETANRAIDRAWSTPESCVPLLHAIARTHTDAYGLQVRSLTNDSRKEVAAAAKEAARQMRSERRNGAGAMIETLRFEQVVSAAQKEKGDARAGRDVFVKQGCIACHTTTQDEPQKGPFLGDIAARYSRAELCESILKPSARIAQGFETQWFKMADDEELEGFVTREGGDEVDVRNVAGITMTISKKQIVARGKREKSIMPEGLADKLTTDDLACLLAYLESLKGKGEAAH